MPGQISKVPGAGLDGLVLGTVFVAGLTLGQAHRLLRRRGGRAGR